MMLGQRGSSLLKPAPIVCTSSRELLSVFYVERVGNRIHRPFYSACPAAQPLAQAHWKL